VYIEQPTIQAAAAGITTLSFSHVLDLVPGDYITLTGWQNTGSALNVEPGTTISLTYLDKSVGSGGSVGAKAQLSANQSIASAVDVPINFDSELFDSDGFHESVTNPSRFTIPSGKSGKYLITATIRYSGNATGFRQTRVHKNGSLMFYNQVEAINSDNMIVRATGVLDCVSGDYIQVVANQNSGTSLSAFSGNYSTDLSIIWLEGLTTDHGALIGLSDDDHPQYAKKAGDTFSGLIVAAGGLDTRLSPTYIDAKAATDGINTYPVGISNHYVNTQGGWPATGAVQTFRDNGVSAGSVQTLTSSGEVKVFQRRSTSTTLWTPWVELGQSEMQFVPAMFSVVQGSPVLSSSYSTTYLPSWAFDPNSNETIAAMWKVPVGWQTVTYDLYWYDKTGSGSVVWGVNVLDGPGVVGQNFTTTGAGGTLATASLGQNILNITSITPSVTAQPGSIMNMTVYRSASSGSDTLTADAYLMMVVARKSA
jgi:hypothetical protein